MTEHPWGEINKRPALYFLLMSLMWYQYYFVERGICCCFSGVCLSEMHHKPSESQSIAWKRLSGCIKGDGRPPCPFPLQGQHGGAEEHWLRATPVRWGFRSWRRRRSAKSTAMTANLWRGNLPSSAGLQRESARSPSFSRAAVLLMSPRTEWTTLICSKYISLSSSWLYH